MSANRILIISPCPGEGAGAEIVLEELLQAWDAADLQLVLLAPEGSRIHRIAIQRSFKWYNLPVKKTGLYLRDNLRAVKAIRKDVSKCDRVHAWTIRVFPAAEWLSRQWNVPVSGTLHDNPFPRKIHGPVLWDMRGMNFLSLRDWREMVWCTQELVLRTWWRWQWAHRAANHFSKMICVSEAVRQECIQKGYKCPLMVVPNGLANIPVPERTPSDKVRIGFLGMEYPQRKGFSVIEQWIPVIGDQVIWKLYGKASKSTIKRIGNRGRKSEGGGQRGEIEYRGFLNRETIFREIDVLVHTSTLFDPLPTVLIEAARAGIPCIASSNGGAAEIVEDGVSGFIFDPSNPEEGLKKLKKLLDPALREKTGCNARQIFEQRFRAGKMTGQYRQIFVDGTGSEGTPRQ